MHVLLWNVTYMFDWQISGQILKDCMGESQAGGLENVELS